MVGVKHKLPPIALFDLKSVRQIWECSVLIAVHVDVQCYILAVSLP